jgi:hypothetical protein
MHFHQARAVQARVKGCEATSPTGEKRSFRMPWNLIAWQLLGQSGLDILSRDESKPDFDTPPADTLWAQILSEVESSGSGALTLAVLSVSEIQDLAEQIHTLSKPLAGMDPQIEVRITLKTKADGDLSAANSILDKIKTGWKL